MIIMENVCLSFLQVNIIKEQITTSNIILSLIDLTTRKIDLSIMQRSFCIGKNLTIEYLFYAMHDYTPKATLIIIIIDLALAIR